MSPEPDWSLYRTFRAVLLAGSFSAAARQLGLTQPTVARHVEALERTIGRALFLRSPRGLEPTEAARALAPFADTLAATAAALLRAASGTANAVAGTVRVSASEVVGVEHLPPILAALRAAHPALVVELTLSNAVDDLLRREADVAVRMLAPAQAALVARKLSPLPFGLYARQDYLARRGVPADLDALRDHDLVGFDRETPAIRAHVARFPMLGRASFALRADNDLAQLAAIRAGFGIGVCQVGLARRDPALRRVLAEQFALELGLWIVMHEDLRASAPCRAVFDALVAGMSTA